jgi:hypothetical protein
VTGRLRLKRDGTRTETRFRLSAKGTNQFKFGASVQSITGSRGVRMVVMLDTPCSEVVWRVLATHSIHQFPLHFPSRESPCAITFQHYCTYLYFALCRGPPLSLYLHFFIVHISPVHPNPSTYTCLSLLCTLLGPHQFLYRPVIAVQILFNEPDAWGSWMFWNVGLVVPDEKASHPRRQ